VSVSGRRSAQSLAHIRIHRQNIGMAKAAVGQSESFYDTHSESEATTGRAWQQTLPLVPALIVFPETNAACRGHALVRSVQHRTSISGLY
jgi:hypothetical protein